MKHRIQHGARRPPGQAAGRIAIEAVFADIEIDRRQIAGAKGEQLLEQALKIIGFVARPHLAIQFRQPVQHPAFQFWHLGRVNLFGFGKPRQIAQQKPQGVAQAAVAVGDAFQDLRPDALIGGIIGLRHPQPQDVGTIFRHHLGGGDDVA